MFRSRATARRRVLPLVLPFALGLLPTDAPAAGPARAPETEVLATVAGRPVTRDEVEREAAGQLARLDQERHRAIEVALDRLVAARLAALDDGPAVVPVSEEEISDDEVLAFYEEHQASIRRPLASIRAELVRFLAQQQTEARLAARRAALEARYPVEVELTPYRAPVDGEGPRRGPDGAVSLVVFSDFECPYCRRIAPTLEELRARFAESLSVEFRQFPLRSLHPKAQLAAEAAVCADDQGAFWRFHDALLLQPQAPALEEGSLLELAAGLGLDGERLRECLGSTAARDRVEADLQAGERIGVTGTPALYVNGRPVILTGDRPILDQIAAVVEDELARVR